jgi:hypothetical protein
VPQWDRYWPIGLASSVVLMAASLTLGVWYLASLFALPQRVGLPPLNDPGELGGDVIWLAGPGGFSLFFASHAARKRSRLRWLALRGDVSKMPLASVVTDPSDAPDAAHLPFPLPWRRMPRGREVGFWLFLLLWGSVLLIVEFAVLVLVAQLTNTDLGTMLGSLVQADIIDDVVLAILLVVVMGFVVLGLIGLIRGLRSPLGPKYALVAGGEGIAALHLKGQGPRLRWGEIRLLEVSRMSARGNERIFTVYGNGRSISWHDFEKPPRKRFRPDIPREEFTCRQRALLALIATRTGLQPRTFSTALMRDDELAKRRSPNSRASVYVVGYGVATLLFLLAMAILALPLTHNLLLNGYAAATTAVSGLGLAAMVRRTLGPRRAGPAQPSLPYALPVAPTAGLESFDLMSRRGLGSRLKEFAIGFALTLDIVPAFAAQANLPDSPLLAFATRAVADLIFLVSIIGMGAIAIALGRSSTHIIVEAGGLGERAGRKATQLAWDAIVLVSAELERDTPKSFLALGRDGEIITWPVHGAIWESKSPLQSHISPEELAALVVARSGVQLTTKEA